LQKINNKDSNYYAKNSLSSLNPEKIVSKSYKPLFLNTEKNKIFEEINNNSISETDSIIQNS